MHRFINIERAISDLQRGQAIVIHGLNGKKIIIIAAENLEVFNKYYQDYQIISVLTAQNRAEFLNFAIKDTINIKNSQIKDHISDLLYSESVKIEEFQIVKADSLEKAAVKLLSYAQIIPIAVIIEDIITDNLIHVNIDDIENYPSDYAKNLTAIVTTSFPILNQGKIITANLTAFRAPNNNKEHLAIIIGDKKNQEIPYVRVHSSCFTGDILNSLACDCADQLDLAIKKIIDYGYGVILYLNQEGRGIGLINKLRAYNLKHKGLDTVDANLALGFNDDDRSFLYAAKMLNILNIDKVKLLTNNPRKSEGLILAGITVTETVPHKIMQHQHNKDYLNTKSARLRHNL